MFYGMRTTIDRAGRVVVPKEIRRRLHLLEGGDVDVDERDGVIEIRPALTEFRVVSGEGGLVAVPAEPLPPLTDEDVRETIDRLRG